MTDNKKNIVYIKNVLIHLGPVYQLLNIDSYKYTCIFRVNLFYFEYTYFENTFVFSIDFLEGRDGGIVEKSV